MIIGLLIILALVLILPFCVKIVEDNLEIFLFIMGLLSTIVAHTLNWTLVLDILKNRFIYMIALAVLVVGLLFRYLKGYLQRGVGVLFAKIHERLFIFLLIVVLGFASSVITAVMSAVALVEIVQAMPITRSKKVKLDIVACFSIGLGAVMTPIGEPLATVVTSRLGQGFWFLSDLLDIYIVTGILLLGIFGAFYIGRTKAAKAAAGADPTVADDDESIKEIIIRAVKILLFVIALELLGAGFAPIIDTYITKLDGQILFWVNMISAVLDNATLASAEISTAMSLAQVKAILMGLLISGGMLIPGNIPNIVSAHRLKIPSREWAKLGVPLGLVMMVICFVALFVI